MSDLTKAAIARINREFIEMMDDPSELTKTAQTANDVIYTRQHESSFLDKIIPPKPITVAECQIDETTDTCYALEEIAEEVDVALVLDWLGQPTGQYIQGERFTVPFIVLSSPRFWKSLKEIRVYQHPITEFIERSAANEIIKRKDAYGITLFDAAVAATAKVHTSTTIKDLTREDFVELFNLIDGDELESKRVLLRRDDFNELLKWKSADLDIKAGDTAFDGVQTATILGREVITSIKNVFDKGVIYCFTDPEYLGKHYTLEDMKFELEKKWGYVQFQSQLEFGCNLGNIYGISKMIIPQEEE